MVIGNLCNGTVVKNVADPTEAQKNTSDLLITALNKVHDSH